MAVNASPGVAGAVSELPLESVAEDSARIGIKKEKPAQGGLDNVWGRG